MMRPPSTSTQLIPALSAFWFNFFNHISSSMNTGLREHGS